MGPSPERSIPKIVAGFLGILTFIAAGLFLLAHFREDLQKPEVRQSICSLSAAVGVFILLFEGEILYSYKAPWYNIETMMTNPGSVPIFGQRLLFIWPAMLLKHLAPRVTYIQAFLAIQAIAIALSVYVVGEWSSLFIGREMKFLGQLLLGIFLFPTFQYYDGHDFGVVIFYTAGLIFLYRKQYVRFGLAVCVGMLNHQNILLLIPTALWILWGREKRSTVLWLVGLTSASYFSIQFILNTVIPIPQTHEIKIWWNMRQIVELQRTLVLGQLALLAWYVVGAAALVNATPFLKRVVILLPMQYGVYFLFGQLNEARLFNGFVPVLIGIFLCHFRSHFDIGRSVA
jgi:hypothetical protein